jgi:hypothetical protein
MNFDQIFSFVERLRKEAIGEPEWIEEKRAYEYADHSAKVVAILKLVRAAHGVSALNLLRQSGLFIDFGVIIRCVNDCRMEIYFLLEEYPKSSENVDRFVKSFFEATIDGYLTAETHVVQSKKIRNAMVRVLKSQHDEKTREIVDRIYKTFSGYVHANYAHIMEVYNVRDRDFSLIGVPDARQRLMRQEHVELAANTVLHMSAYIAGTLGLNKLYHEIVQTFRTR